MPTSTSISISQFLALQISGLQISGVQGDQGDRISGVLADPAVGVAVGVAAVGDASSQHGRRGPRPRWITPNDWRLA
jgi:hypothetical protein